MRQGSTPTFRFKVPFEKKSISKARILFGYGNVLILKKEASDLKISDNLIETTLTQEETFLFIPDSEADVIVRVLTHEAKAFVSNGLKTIVEGIMDKEVL